MHRLGSGGVGGRTAREQDDNGGNDLLHGELLGFTIFYIVAAHVRAKPCACRRLSRVAAAVYEIA